MNKVERKLNAIIEEAAKWKNAVGLDEIAKAAKNTMQALFYTAMGDEGVSIDTRHFFEKFDTAVYGESNNEYKTESQRRLDVYNIQTMHRKREEKELRHKLFSKTTEAKA